MTDLVHKGESPAPLQGAALIADVVESRDLADRAEFQRRLLDALSTVNADLGEDVLAAPLALTAGDEFQGFFRRPEGVVPAVVALADVLRPARLVYGLGWGALSTDPSPRVAEMDGPCFHRARQALEATRAVGGWVTASGFGAAADPTVTALFRLLDAVRSRWTDKQALYAREVRGRLQKQVAREHGVSPSVVSESLKAAAFDAVREGERALASFLAEFGSETESRTDSLHEEKA